MTLPSIRYQPTVIVLGTPNYSQITGENGAFEAKKSFSGPMAGCESDGGNTLLTDFVLLASKLEKLGFRLSQGKVCIVNM